MVRSTAVAMTSALLLLAAGSPAPVVAATGVGAMLLQVRQACDADGRCYETGDPGYRDDDAPPPPRRRFDPDDGDRPPPPRGRYERDDDLPPPPPGHRYDPDDDRTPPPPRGRYERDDD